MTRHFKLLQGKDNNIQTVHKKHLIYRAQRSDANIKEINRASNQKTLGARLAFKNSFFFKLMFKAIKQNMYLFIYFYFYFCRFRIYIIL